MAQVNVTINGRQFRMACEDGQEEHLQQLAEDLDERIVELRGQFGEIGDTRLTVMAALTVADELAEAGKRCAGWKRSSPPCRTRACSPPTAPARRQARWSRPSIPPPSGSRALTRKLNQTVADPAKTTASE